jgi:hypothetical protein
VRGDWIEDEFLDGLRSGILQHKRRAIRIGKVLTRRLMVLGIETLEQM